MNKRVAMIVDCYNWAFDFGAKAIKEKLAGEYDIDIFASNDEKFNEDLFLILESVKEYDYIHFFWRRTLLQFDEESFKYKVNNAGYNYDEYIKVCKKISTGVYDHLFLDSENIEKYKNVFNTFCSQYCVCSEKLFEIYNNIAGYNKPWGVIMDTYNENLMKPGNLERFEDYNKKLVIGWVGNSAWNIKYADFKGVNTILNPVIDELQSERYDIEKYYADKQTNPVDNPDMPKYFETIDVCVCVSSCEGTPRPVIEAMACGVPVISTDVGIVKDVLGEKQKDYIIGDRRNGENDEIVRTNLKDRIIELYNNREKLKELSDENLKMAYKTSSSEISQRYRDLFKG